jgi:hypothetical protein
MMKFSTAMKLGRVSNLPTVWSNVLAGVVLAGGTALPSSIVRLGLMATLFYVGGMFLNDAFDAEIDARERPERPIPAGEVEVATVFRWAAAMLGLGLVLASSLGVAPFVGGLATVALIVIYDRNHKGNPIAPLVMGLCRVGLYLTAALTVAPALPAPVWIGALVLLGYVLGLTFAAKFENSDSIIRFGPLLGLWAPALVSLSLLRGPIPAAALLLGFCVWVVRSTALVRTRQPPQIRRGIVSLIAGISLVDALLIAGQGHVELALLTITAFASTLALQRLVSGT